MSASITWTLWNSTSCLPNCSRSWTYFSALSSAAWPIARLIVVLPRRSMEKMPKSRPKAPAGTTTFSSGTSTLSK